MNEKCVWFLYNFNYSKHMELTHINSKAHTYIHTIYTFIQPPAFRRKANLTILIFKQYSKVWQKVGKHWVNPTSPFLIHVGLSERFPCSYPLRWNWLNWIPYLQSAYLKYGYTDRRKTVIEIRNVLYLGMGGDNQDWKSLGLFS